MRPAALEDGETQYTCLQHFGTTSELLNCSGGSRAVRGNGRGCGGRESG